MRELSAAPNEERDVADIAPLFLFDNYLLSPMIA
jgi:hypothetical protein